MRIVVLPAARRDIVRLAADITRRIGEHIGALEYNPRPPGCALIRDSDLRAWRIRVGDYRIFYAIDDGAGLVTILRILHRSVAYRR
jgi:mRNA interferase RelE/StbE